MVDQKDILCFKEVTINWLHNQYIRKLRSTLGARNLELNVGFCVKQSVDFPDIINILKVNKQSSHNLQDALSGILYY